MSPLLKFFTTHRLSKVTVLSLTGHLFLTQKISPFFKSIEWDFLGSLVVQTAHLQCRGYRFHPWWEKLRSHIMLCGVVKNR